MLLVIVMGARSKRTKHRNPRAAMPSDETSNPQLPRCVSKLQSESYSELEEACGDLTYYATQAKLHTALVACGVPQRLVQLLSQLPFNDAISSEVSLTARIHQGILNYQVAAVEALRNMITNSTEDDTIDLLDAGTYADPQGQCMVSIDYASLLLRRVTETWGIIEEVNRCVKQSESGVAAAACGLHPELDEFDESETADEGDGASRLHSRAARQYINLLRFQEELLHLAVVSVDGSEAVTKAFSQPSAVAMLLHQLEVCTDEICRILQNDSLWVKSDERPFFVLEALRLVRVAVAIADVLHTLSSDNEPLVSCFLHLATDGSGVTSAQKAWLDNFTVGTRVMTWLSSQPSDITVEGAAPVDTDRDWVMHMMLECTLSIQGMLLNLFPSEENTRRVLPLIVQVLTVFMPIQQWRLVLPLLKDSCDMAEEQRSGVVRVCTSRLRASKTAIDVLNNCVSFICSGNAEDEADDVAFAKNPLSPLLFESNALYAFGNVLKDALWLERDNGGSSQAHLDVLRQSEQRALRLSAQSNSEVTTMQFVILSTEVGIWNTASALLLMIATETLGETSLIWRAFIAAIHQRSELLRLAYLSDISAASVVDGPALEPTVCSVATESPAARHLLWLQLKSLLQILWTLQRKQFAQSDGFLDTANILAAMPSDVDLLTRLAWEKDSPPSLLQACVATVAHVCCSFQDVESIVVATRFALSALQNAGGQGLSLLHLADSVLRSPAPTVQRERVRWLSKLQRADAAVSARCEAANALIDIFSDERFDTSVYVPLGVQAELLKFFQQLKTHIASRQRVANELWKNHRVEASASDAGVWTELCENLDGFLDYKRRHVSH